MVEPDATAKHAALRALETWRAYFEDRDPLVRAARRAGATIAEIMEASGLAKNTVRSALAEAEPAATEDTMTTTVDPITRYRHPHLVDARPGPRTNETTYTMRPFTGYEPRPEMPRDPWHDQDLTHEDRLRLAREYDALDLAWAKAVFKLKLRPVLADAAQRWREYADARRAMDELFAAFADLQDGKWKSQTLRLAEAHRRARAAAQRFDEIGEQLAVLEREHLTLVGEREAMTTADAASELGVDARDWYLSWLEDYQPAGYQRDFLTPLTRRLAQDIEAQQEQLREVDGLSGTR